MGKRMISVLVTLLICLSVIAQGNKKLQESFMEAEFFFISGDYADALNYYLPLFKQLPDNANLEYRIGICYLNIPGEKNLAVNFLENAAKNMSAKYREGTIKQTSAPYNALYELAVAYRINHDFDKAKEAFVKYSETLLPDDKENIDFINHEIEICDKAKELIDRPVSFIEENLGDKINDDKANFNPVISSDGNSFIFMVSLKFYDAVMFSRLINGSWSAPLNITPELQSDGDFYISCLSSDGKLLFLSKDDNYDSDIYSSSYDGNSWSKAEKLNMNINTKNWESHGFISDDGNKLIFASDRPGGFGGLDLYVSEKVDGDWGPAINLGPEINTKYNEDRPFQIANGKTLFFSSQGHENMGGYDLFKSDIQTNGLWSKPQNLGYPINTPDDNIFFMPAGDGKSGYYSRQEESGGFGKEDIYKIIFK